MPHLIAIEYSEAQRRQLKSEIDRLSKAGYPLSAKYDAETFGTWDKLFETAIAPGLFAEREIIVVENAETLDAFPENLSPLIEDDKADTVIILVFNTDTKNLKAAAKSITLIKPEAQVPPWKRKDWLISLAKEQGFKISPDAANLLSESIESQEELRGELSKLAFYAEGREIVREDVEALSFDEGGKAQQRFIDGICDNKPREVAWALRHLREKPILQVINAITNRLRPALLIETFPERLRNDAMMAIDLDPVKKKYAIGKARNALKYFGAERIKRFIFGAIRLSFLEKTNSAEGWEGFEVIVWELMAKV